MIKRSEELPYVVELGSIARIARAAKVFEVNGDMPGGSWHQWALMESRRR